MATGPSEPARPSAARPGDERGAAGEPTAAGGLVESWLADLTRVRPEPVIDPKRPAPDWEALAARATRLGVFPLVAQRLVGRVPLPEAVEARWRRQLDFLALRQRMVLADVERLAGQLDRQGERVVLLKGSALGPYVYPDTGLRAFSDVDVLVRDEALDAAVGILAELGYRERERIEGSVEMVRAARGRMGAAIELHTRLLHHQDYPYYRQELKQREAGLIARAEPRKLGQSRVWVLPAADELVYSVVHFLFHHDLEGLRYHGDLNALLNDPARPLDVAEVVAAAQRWGAAHAVGLTLMVHRALLGEGAVPPALAAALEPRGLRRRLLLGLLPPLGALAFRHGRVAGHPVKVAVAPGIRAPLRLFARWVFPGRRFLSMYYRLGPADWKFRYHLRYAAGVLGKIAGRAARIGA